MNNNNIRNGFTITWIKDGRKQEFTNESYVTVDRRRQGLRTKRVKVSEIKQCIF